MVVVKSPNQLTSTNPQTTTAQIETLPRSFNLKEINPKVASRLDPELLKSGITRYKDLTGYERGGIKVLEHKIVPDSTLKLRNYGRIGVSVGAIGFIAAAAIGLATAGVKLLFNAVSGKDTEDSYNLLGKAYAGSSIAGALTGLAQERWEWVVGAAGMGAVGATTGLKGPGSLSLFSLFDGLQNIGMGLARKRDEKNITAVTNSIFNVPALSKFKPLVTIEQAVLRFLKNFTNLKRITEVEPYALFEEAGGGQIVASTVLGAASLLKNKMSDSLKSLFYLPFSIFSGINLIALFRDGSAVLKRSRDFGSKKKLEKESMWFEGQAKRIAAPVLGVNNLLLGLKGLGLDPGGVVYHLASGVRALGAAEALLGFGAQIFQKFPRPEKLITKLKEIIKIRINPMVESKRLFTHMDNVDSRKPEAPPTDKFHDIIYDENNDMREVLHDIICTPKMQRLKEITQTGIAIPSSADHEERYYLNRLIHSKRVCALAIIVFNALLKHTKDPELRKHLESRREGFIIGALTHDLGHILCYSHAAEEFIEGWQNDEGSIDILKRDTSIFEAVKNHYGEDRAKEIIQQARENVGSKSYEAPAYKLCDYIEYVRCGDFPLMNEEAFPKWTTDEIKIFADNIRFIKDKNDRPKIAFTKSGGIMMLQLLYDRKLGNDYNNSHPINLAEALPLQIGLKVADITYRDFKTNSEKGLRKIAERALEKLNGSTQFEIYNRQSSGSGSSYAGYDDNDPKIQIMLENGITIGRYINSKEFEDDFPCDIVHDTSIRYLNLTTSREVDYITEASTIDTSRFRAHSISDTARKSLHENSYQPVALKAYS
ncbi:MAG: hypothetical protein HY094_04250 [Candidatus Melainabacteria bacterium]|nr:hypothetical protein [Candidatus Melainabacteria bacterium]